MPIASQRFAYIGVLVSTLILSGCEKYFLDRKMEELCKVDGGVKIYETVTLPPEMFDQWGGPFPGWNDRSSKDRLGQEYGYEYKSTQLKKGDVDGGEGALRRIEVRIFRRSNGKLLGEGIFYGRTGGDSIVARLLGSHPSSKACPNAQSEGDVLRGVFIQEAHRRCQALATILDSLRLRTRHMRITCILVMVMRLHMSMLVCHLTRHKVLIQYGESLHKLTCLMDLLRCCCNPPLLAVRQLGKRYWQFEEPKPVTCSPTGRRILSTSLGSAQISPCRNIDPFPTSMNRWLQMER